MAAEPKTSTFPLGRLVALLSPAIATVAGALATWLLARVHFLSLFHVTQDQAANIITQAVIFAVTALGTYALHHKWLDGWSRWERFDAAVKANLPPAVPGLAPAPAAPPTQQPPPSPPPPRID